MPPKTTDFHVAEAVQIDYRVREIQIDGNPGLTTLVLQQTDNP